MTTIVQTTVESSLWDQADAILKEHGMTVEDCLSALLSRVVREHNFPLELRKLNADTLEAIRELERGEGHSYSSVEKLFADVDNW